MPTVAHKSVSFRIVECMRNISYMSALCIRCQWINVIHMKFNVSDVYSPTALSGASVQYTFVPTNTDINSNVTWLRICPPIGSLPVAVSNGGAWASCQISKIAGCAGTGNAGNVFPSPWDSDADMHQGKCLTHVPWCMPGSLTSGFL